MGVTAEGFVITLALDTSTTFLAIAALRENEVIFSVASDIGRQHGELLLPTLQRELAAHQLAPQEIRKIITGIGPGSYTGVKIALATAKGIAAGSGAELLGYTSLAGLLPGGQEPHTEQVLMVDAGRGRYYAQRFRQENGFIQVMSEPWRVAAGEELPVGELVYWDAQMGVRAEQLARVYGVESRLFPYYL